MPDKAAFYVTSIDRLGLALGAGGLLAGAGSAALSAYGGQNGPGGIVAAFILGAFVAMAACVAVIGPVWLLMHLTNRRGPGHAALTAGLVALALVIGGVGWRADPTSVAPWWYRLASGAATGAALGLAAALLGWVMHRIAYRRLL